MKTPDFGPFPPIDPDLCGLLREIAARQEARLLRASPAPRPARFLRADEPVRPSATGLLAAERELLRRFREETAHLLRQLTLARLYEYDSLRRITCAYVDRHRRIEIPAPAPTRRRLEREATRIQSSFGTDLSGRELLEAAATGLTASPSPTTLAGIVLRLTPHDDVARLYAARDWLRTRSMRAAIESLHGITHGATRVAVRACAASWLGVALAMMGDHHEAATAQRRASDLDPSVPGYVSSWLAFALQAGNMEDVLEAARRLNAICGPSDAALADWLASVHEQRMLGEWKPSRAARVRVSTLLGRLDGASQRILYAFL